MEAELFSNESSPCRGCGGARFIRSIGPHRGGHYARIDCAACNRFQKWEGNPNKPQKTRKGQAKLIELYSGGFCEICLRNQHEIPAPQTLEAHHIIEVQNGGSDEEANILICCTACHKLIHHQRTYLGHYIQQTHMGGAA